MNNYTAHEIANIFPLMQVTEFECLKIDISKKGLIEPIWIYEGKILDGRNRFNACQSLGLGVTTREYTGSDPLGFVVSLNKERRHLTASQLATVAVDLLPFYEAEAKKRQLATLKQFKVNETSVPPQMAERENEPKNIESRDIVAEIVGVSHGYVSDAKKLKETNPEIYEQVKSGAITITKALRALRKESLYTPQPPTGKYRVIYADPPWSYNDKCDNGAIQSGGAEKHYPSMTIEELCELPIKDIAEDDSVLFLWVTSPLLVSAYPIIEAWGFCYKTSFIWDKIKHNMGHYNSVRHELLLVCTRGSCTPDVAHLFDSVQSIERTAHSVKPEMFRTIIDTIYNAGTRIELFRRGAALENWDTWGNEALESA